MIFQTRISKETTYRADKVVECWFYKSDVFCEDVVH